MNREERRRLKRESWQKQGHATSSNEVPNRNILSQSGDQEKSPVPDQHPGPQTGGRVPISLFKLVFKRAVSRMYLLIRRVQGRCGPTASTSAIVRWIWKNLIVDAGTVMGVVYLIYSSLAQTLPTVSSAGSDPNNPLFYPFSVINNSNIFEIRVDEFTCIVSALRESNNTEQNNTIGYKAEVEILPGQVSNFACPDKAIISDAKIIAMTANIALRYSVDIFGLIRLHRDKTEYFTWPGGTGAPQWIRGRIGR